jgi:hypothetical protein
VKGIGERSEAVSVKSAETAFYFNHPKNLFSGDLTLLYDFATISNNTL